MPPAPPTTSVELSPLEILPGIWRLTVGAPEAITPVRTRQQPPAAEALARLPSAAQPPVAVRGSVSDRGVLLRLPLETNELIYGLGLQLQSFQQRGSKKTLRVNADPALDSGDSHAPVPFYVTTRGYGVLVDTARYATFYLGNKPEKAGTPTPPPEESDTNDGWNGIPPYQQKGLGRPSEVLVEVPGPARGVDVYLFAGPTLRTAVQRYNLFSGAGPMPPRWGLGFWYRLHTDASQADALRLADELRERRIPCDVLGLEPHWQSHSYSCSYTWSARFPDPAGLLQQLRDRQFRVNVWEQAFVHPSSPLHRPLHARSGDREVWGGLVPDFLDPEARRLFADHHEQAHAALGVAGYKADECDNSDFTGGWSFPELSRFPSGADGEQMHSLFGLRYLDALQLVFERRRQRTFGLVRSLGALATPYPYVLYSDLYDHPQFVHAVAQAGFSGLLWTPEVRDAASPEDFLRRLQAVVFSPLAMVNAWYLRNPPWKQVRQAANDAGDFAPGWEMWEARCRELIELRMRFLPYVHAAFGRYHEEGLPPFRAPLMDDPDNPALLEVSDQYLMGDSVLVAPILSVGGARSPAEAGSRRTVVLPRGDWHDFWTGTRHAGGGSLEVTAPLDRIPLFVRSGTILPLAKPTLHTEDPASWEISARVYGDGALGGRLVEDDGAERASLTEVRLAWDAAARRGSLHRADGAPPRYRVVEWLHLP